MRLDIYLHEKDIFNSREKARRAVLEGAVSVNGNIILKPAYEIGDFDDIQIVKETNPYVGRGGIKLKAALEYFNVDLSGVTALDVGASTGGFTDCMLKNGAVAVYACDVGSNQLDVTLKNDSRVVNLENTDIRNVAVSPEKYGIGAGIKFEFVTVDVSFISLTKVLPAVKMLLQPEGKVLCLIKPQFEFGDIELASSRKFFKNGIIKDPSIHKKVCGKISGFAQGIGYKVLGIIDSPVTGGSGNKEFLMMLESATLN